MKNIISMLPEERRLVFERTESLLNLPARSIEKDFWTCLVLRQIFELPKFGSHFTFKGGTSLSKAWQLIERFSEDADLVIDKELLGFSGKASPESAPSKTQRRAKLEELKLECARFIQQDLLPALTLSLKETLPNNEHWNLFLDDLDKDGQTLLFDYPRCLPKEMASYLTHTVKIEMGARSEDWPSQEVKIKPDIAESLPHLLSDPDCRVKVLAAERTFWEKATLLHEETFRPVDKPRKNRMARHYYDLWCLIRAGIAARAIKEQELFERVVEHRSLFFNWSWVDYSTMCRGSLRLIPLDSQLAEWRSDYEAMKSEMFFGKVPSFDEILETIGQFEKEFNLIGIS